MPNIIENNTRLEKLNKALDKRLPFSVDVSDIIIGEENTFDHYINNESRYVNKINRKYNADDKSSKVILSIKKTDAPKYVLQDIAFEYGKMTKKPVLLIIGSDIEIDLTTDEKQKLRDENKKIPKSKNVFRLYFINSKEPFNHHLYGYIDIPVENIDEPLAITEEVKFKLETLMNHFDFYIDTIHIISPKNELGYRLKPLLKYKKYAENIIFLDNSITIDLFKKSKPFELSSKARRIAIIGIFMSLIATFFLYSFVQDFNAQKVESDKFEIAKKKKEFQQAKNALTEQQDRNKKLLQLIEDDKVFATEKDIK